MLKKLTYLLIAMALMVLPSCSDDTQEGPMGPTTRVLTVSPPEASVNIGSTVTFAAVGGIGTYTWEVTQPNIGTITTGGIFTPLTPGEATIVCTDTRGLRGTSHIAVNRNTVTISPVVVTIDYNSTVTFTASGGTGTYFWWAEPPTTFGTIDQSGIFTSAFIDGAATISATDGYGNVGSALVTVRGVPMTISPTAISLSVGNTTTFTAAGGAGSFTWASSDTAVGTIGTSGTTVTFTALAAGTTTITLTDSDGNTKTAAVTVSAVGAGGTLMIVPGAVLLNKSDTYQFAAYGGQQTYVWSSSNPSIGTIDTNGLFTAGTTDGIATITVTDTLGATDTSSAEVVASTINASPATATIPVASNLSLVGIGGDGAYWWSSSDAGIATVATQATTQSSTTVTAVGGGTATINIADDSGNTGTATITVVALSPIAISPTNPSIAVGTDITVIATGGSGAYWWSTNDGNIASVSVQVAAVASTTLSAIGTGATPPGTTTLTAIDENGESATTTVTVVAATPVVISPPTATLTAGSTLTAVATGGNGSYWWSSSNEPAATVSTQTQTESSTVITAVAAGNVTITAVDDSGNFGTATITVP